MKVKFLNEFGFVEVTHFNVEKVENYTWCDSICIYKKSSSDNADSIGMTKLQCYLAKIMYDTADKSVEVLDLTPTAIDKWGESYMKLYEENDSISIPNALDIQRQTSKLFFQSRIAGYYLAVSTYYKLSNTSEAYLTFLPSMRKHKVVKLQVVVNINRDGVMEPLSEPYTLYSLENGYTPTDFNVVVDSTGLNVFKENKNIPSCL